MTKKAKIYNGEMTVSSISDTGKTGQMHAISEIRLTQSTQNEIRT